MINGKLEYRVLLRCKRLTAWCRMKHVCNHVSVAFFAYQVELCFHHGLRHLQATPWFSFANLPSPLLRMNNVSTHLSILIQEQWSVLAVMPVQVLLTECQDLCSHPNWSYLWCILKGHASEGLYADGRTHAHTHTAWIRLTSAATKAATGPCLWILPAKIQRQEKGQGHQKH